MSFTCKTKAFVSGFAPAITGPGGVFAEEFELKHTIF